jgi:hypothetical protein
MMQHVCIELDTPPLADQSFEGRLLLGLEGQLDAQGVFPVVFQPLQLVKTAYEEWVGAYRECAKATRLGAVGNQITNISSPLPHLLQDVRAKYQIFVERLQRWLNETRVNDLSSHGDVSSSCFGLANYLFNPFGESRHLFVQTPTLELWRYPWHEWFRIRNHLELEVVFMPRFYRPLQNPHHRHPGVRILAIFGREHGLNLSGDFSALRALPNVELHSLVTPSLGDLVHLWQEPWDILFYAGHSGNGAIDVDSRLEIQQIRDTLQYAAQQGLQLGIFNSCESIDIAQQLVQLGVPHVIGMREVIPDLVAQRFLQYFLSNFQRGADLYTAVARARSQLRELVHIEEHLPGTASLPLICRHPQARPLTWAHLQQGSRTTIVISPDSSSPLHQLPDLLFWCRLQLDLAQQEFAWVETSYFNYQTAQSLQYQQSLQNVVHWACGVLRTFGSFETSPQLRFFFAALQLDAEATLEQVAAQRAIPYLQHLATKEHGLHRTQAAILIMQQQPNDAHLQQALQTFEQALLQKTPDIELRQRLVEQLHQFLVQVPLPLVQTAWNSTQGRTLAKLLCQLANNTQETTCLRLAAATAMGLAGGSLAQQATEIALTILRHSSSLEDVIAASRCLQRLNAHLAEVESRLLHFLDWATVHSHQVALCRALGVVHPGHTRAIQTLETLIRQQIYDTDTLLMAVAALQRIAPEHSLPHETLATFVTRATAIKDAVDFYQGLSLMKALKYPIAPYLSAAVVRWMREEIHAMEARQEPYLHAPYTVLWYCIQHLLFGEIAKELQ